MAYIIELDAYLLPAGPVQTLRWSDGQGFTTRPGDSPANTFIAPRLSQPLLARRDLFDKATTYGVISAGAGEVRLLNIDGALDSLLTGYAVNGRELRAWRGNEGDPWPSAWQRIMTGRAELAQASGSEVVISLRDPLAQLDKPLLSAVYVGNNALPAGLEGTADDLKDKRKPRVLGKVFNISPPQVNTARLIYQLSDRAASVTAVYDRGVSLSAGSAYATLADLQATAPAAGQYRVYSGAEGCFVRLGTAAAGTVTADAASSETRAASLAAQVATDMGLTLAAADVTALNAANASAVGVWVQDDATALAVLSDLLGSVGAWGGFDADGVLRAARLIAPGAATASLQRDRIMSLSLLSTADSDAGLPAWRVTVEYARNYSVSNDLAASVTAARKAWCAEPNRKAVASDAGRQTVWPGAPELTFATCLCNAADAASEATRRLALYGGRQLFEVRYRPAAGERIDLDQTITLTHPRYGLSAGRALRVIGVVYNHRLDELTLRLWG